MKSLKILLAYLRALYFHYQTAHWEVQGPSYYSDHLLFQRLYEEIAEEIDVMGEKIVGSYGPCLDAFEQSLFQTICLRAWKHITCPVKKSLYAEELFLKVLHKAKSELEASGELTYGMDDFLGSVSSLHEDHLFHLRQRMGGR